MNPLNSFVLSDSSILMSQSICHLIQPITQITSISIPTTQYYPWIPQTGVSFSADLSKRTLFEQNQVRLIQIDLKLKAIQACQEALNLRLATVQQEITNQFSSLFQSNVPSLAHTALPGTINDQNLTATNGTTLHERRPIEALAKENGSPLLKTSSDDQVSASSSLSLNRAREKRTRAEMSERPRKRANQQESSTTDQSSISSSSTSSNSTSTSSTHCRSHTDSPEVKDYFAQHREVGTLIEGFKLNGAWIETRDGSRKFSLCIPEAPKRYLAKLAKMVKTISVEGRLPQFTIKRGEEFAQSWRVFLIPESTAVKKGELLFIQAHRLTTTPKNKQSALLCGTEGNVDKKGLYLERLEKGNFSHLIRKCNEPNAEVKVFLFDGLPIACVTAIEQINPGNELLL